MTNTDVTNRSKSNLPQSFQGNPVVAPLVDVYENRDEYLVVADLPGVQPEKLNVRLEKGELLVEGTTSESDLGSPVGREFRPVDYRRLFLVPDAIHVEGVEARLTDGVLRVRIPKSEAVKPKKIQIQVG